jgi:hypothetical protein
MRVLTAVTIGMGVLILVGTTVLLVTILHRASAPAATAAPLALTLHEPAGTAIDGVAAAGGRLAIALHGGGPDRVVLVDPHSGTVTGTIVLRP